jgi:hypothetical protein
MVATTKNVDLEGSLTNLAACLSKLCPGPRRRSVHTREFMRHDFLRVALMLPQYDLFYGLLESGCSQSAW